jgi:diadenosine tetraphosphate (Ap4A) HIT family hydrolase
VPTAIHRMVERCRAGEFPRLIQSMDSGWLIMAEQQVLPGYCLLLPDPVAPHLNALSEAARRRFLADMARAGDALLAATGAARVNYALFGNVEPALHAHLFPRMADEPDTVRLQQPWALDWRRAPPYAEATHGELKRRIAAALPVRPFSPE